MKPGDRVLYQDRHCRHSENNPKGWRIGTITTIAPLGTAAYIDGKGTFYPAGVITNPEDEARLRYAMIAADKDFAEGVRLAEQARDARYRIAIEKWCKPDA